MSPRPFNKGSTARRRTAYASPGWAVSATDPALVDAILVEHLEEFVIVAVVHIDADDHRSLSIERLLHNRRDVVGLLDHETGRAECLGILDVVDRTEIDSRSAAVFELLLNGDHVVPA